MQFIPVLCTFICFFSGKIWKWDPEFIVIERKKFFHIIARPNSRDFTEFNFLFLWCSLQMLHQCGSQGAVPQVFGPEWPATDWRASQPSVSVPDPEPALQRLYSGLLHRQPTTGPQQVCLQPGHCSRMCREDQPVYLCPM